MNPALLAIKYKQLAVVILLILITAGIFAFITMPRQEDPDSNPPVAQITTVFPGANPLQVEQLVTSVIEEELAEITDIKRINSSSSKAFSSIIMELDHGIDAEKVWDKVREKLNQLPEKLPAEAKEPQINTELVKTITSLISVSSQDLALASQVALSLEAELAKLPAVAKVDMVGEEKQELVIMVDDQKLAQYHLTLEQLINSVRANNISLPGAMLNLEGYRASLSAPNQLTGVQDLAGIVVGISPQGYPLKLGDVAQVSWDREEEDFILRTNGRPAVTLEITMRERENVVKLGKAIDGILADARAKAPGDVTIHLIADQPGDVAARLSNFTNTLFFGMMLVVLTVFLSMGWRNALIVSLAIPLSVILGFAGMGLWQISLHQVSIAALVIALGILVDNAIVVNDNIYRHWQQGTPILEACTKGLKEVAIPVLSSTLTTIAAFIPLMMMPGDVGEFIKSIPQVVSLTLSSSLLIAATITPLVFYLLMKNRPITGEELSSTKKHDGSSLTRPLGVSLAKGLKARLNLSILINIYLNTLLQAIRRPGLTLAVALAFLAGSILLVSRLDVEFFPASDKNLMMAQVAAPAGTGLAATDEVVREIEAFLAKQPQVTSYTSYTGRGVPKFYYNIFPAVKAANTSQIMITLDLAQGAANGQKTDLTTRFLASDWQNQLQNKLGNARVRIDLLEQGPPVGAPVAFRITGPDLTVLAELADQATALLQTIPGTTAQTHSLAIQELLTEAVVSPERAAMAGITTLDTANTLRYYNTRQEITTVKDGTGEIPVQMAIAGSGTVGADLESLWITSATTGLKVPLGQIARLEPTWQWTNISHWENERTVFVYSYVESNTSANQVYTKIIPLLDSLDLPPGYRLEIGGQMEDQLVSFGNLAQAGLTAVLLIYLILIFQFNSLTQPLLIVMAIPFTVIGAVVGLFLLGYPIGFMAFLGLVSLVGIVVNNAIVLVDFINCRRRDGIPLTEAVMTAGKQRLRPILLTTATTIGGLLPLSITGGNMWGPMGFAIIFGLLGSTLLTLVVVPVLYVLIEGRAEAKAAAKTSSA